MSLLWEQSASNTLRAVCVCLPNASIKPRPFACVSLEEPFLERVTWSNVNEPIGREPLPLVTIFIGKTLSILFCHQLSLNVIPVKLNLCSRSSPMIASQRVSFIPSNIFTLDPLNPSILSRFILCKRISASSLLPPVFSWSNPLRAWACQWWLVQWWHWYFSSVSEWVAQLPSSWHG